MSGLDLTPTEMITALSEIEANAEKYENGVLFLSKKAAQQYEWVLQAVTAHLLNQQREAVDNRKRSNGKYFFFPYEIQFMVNVLNLDIELQNLKFGAMTSTLNALSKKFSRIKDDHISVEKEERDEDGVTIINTSIGLSPYVKFDRREDSHDE